ncbi:hypothetical protein J6590_083434 [Homalodisca vitripennis]|nr:hypothetical protein J6590_083434 [Homalodisca vitripennis]
MSRQGRTRSNVESELYIQAHSALTEQYVPFTPTVYLINYSVTGLLVLSSLLLTNQSLSTSVRISLFPHNLLLTLSNCASSGSDGNDSIVLSVFFSKKSS